MQVGVTGVPQLDPGVGAVGELVTKLVDRERRGGQKRAAPHVPIPAGGPHALHLSDATALAEQQPHRRDPVSRM